MTMLVTVGCSLGTCENSANPIVNDSKIVKIGSFGRRSRDIQIVLIL